MQKESTKGALKIIGLVAAAAVTSYLVWKLSDVIILIITAAIIAATLNPMIKWLERNKISRKTASALVMIMLVLPVVFVLVTIIPVFLKQLDNIANAMNAVITNFPLLPKIFRNLDLAQYTKDAGQYLLVSTSAITAFFAQLVILVFMIYYLLIDAESIYRLFSVFIPKKNRAKTDEALSEISVISGQYIRGNLFISFVCSLIIFVGLLFLRVPGSAALAVFAGIMDLLPLVGATIGAVPAVILAFAVSPMTGLFTILLFFLYQEVENDYLIPRVYHKALKIIPFLSFISVIIGTILFGVAGAFLALPIAASIPTLVHYFFGNGKALIKNKNI